MAEIDSTAGSVGVRVYGDLSQLRADLEAGRRETEKFDRDMAKGSSGSKAFARSADDAAKAVRALGLSEKYWLATADRRNKALEMFERHSQRASKQLGELKVKEDEAAASADKAAKSFENAAKGTEQMEKFSSKAGAEVRKLAGYVVAAAAAGFIAMTKAALDNAKALKEQSAQLGMSAESLQKWYYIGQQTGVAASDINTGFENLGRSMGKAAAGAERESKAFDLLGISLTNVDGSAKSTAQVMPELADALNRIEDANQRAAVAQIFFGESAAEIMPALKGGSTEIDKLAEAADNLGIVLSTEELKKLDETNQKLEDMKTVLSADISSTIANNSDAIMSLASALGELASLALQAGAAYISFWDSVGAYAGKSIGGALARDPETASWIQNVGAIFGVEKGGGAPARAPGTDADGSFSLFKTFGGMPGTGPKGGPIDASSILAPRGRTGRRTRDPHRERAFENQLKTLQVQVLRGLESQTKNANDRAALQLQILDIEKGTFAKTLAIDVSKGKYTKAEGEILASKFAELDAQKRAIVELEQREQNRKDSLELSNAMIESDSSILQIQRELVRSNREKREIDLDLLDMQYSLRRANEQAVLDSETSSDLDKQIAAEKMGYLEQWKELQAELIRRETEGPVAEFFRNLRLSGDELNDRLEQVRVDRLQDQIDRSAQMADDISGAFADVGRGILSLQNPLDILKNLLFSLTDIFNEEVIIRPLQDMVRQNIGGPLAEMTTGAPAGPDGLWIDKLGSESLKASFAIDRMTLAATQFAQGLQVGMIGGGGGGGGIMGLISGVASTFIPSSGLVADVTNTINANPGIFDEGGLVGPNGMPIRRKPSNVDITAEVGEYVIPPGPTRAFRRELDMIRAGKRPDFGGGLSAITGGRPVNISMGDIVLAGAKDERGIRRAARQAASDIGRDVARAAKTGLVK